MFYWRRIIWLTYNKFIYEKSYRNAHKKKNNNNIATFLRYPINEFKKGNEITLKLKIENNEINKEIYFLDNTVNNKGENNTYLNHGYLKELNENNVILYINDKKQKNYQKYFKPENEGIHSIKLLFNVRIRDCSYMFYNSTNITEIDLSLFDTKYTNNMKMMFENCENLISINFDSFNTEKVSDMNSMFKSCKNLNSLDLSYFHTEKVTNMGNMFNSCAKLEKINISSFNTKNVSDMSSMFESCNNLNEIILSSFDTQNVTNMGNMFNFCVKLENIDLSNFNTEKVINMERMFADCQELTKII